MSEPSPTERPRRTGMVRRAVASAMAVAVTVAACAPNPAPGSTDPGPTTDLSFLRARTGTGAAIVDAFGREVQLRGANANHLGDYHQAYLELPVVSALTDEDWADMAGLGFNVVRLVTNWSLWEPTRGELDETYLSRVRAAVDAANRYGIWVVIDMHQDAWSSVVFTPPDETCPTGTTHQKGWDGAPGWATDTGGRPTCTPTRREESPAVMAAWDAFYTNRNGIRTALATTWGRIASAFADNPGVAGFDLLNEPNHGNGLDLTITGLGEFYRESLSAIRSAEDAVDARHHLVFFEPTVNGAVVPPFSPDPNLVWAPHIYAESIGPAIDGLLDLQTAVLQRLIGEWYGRPVWIGEYGSFSDATTNTSWMARFAALHDSAGHDGGAWWQWEQECGDPHTIKYPADAAWVEAARGDCDGSRMPVACPTRSYGRAIPGVVTQVAAAPCGGALTVSGSTPRPSTADLWFAPAPGASADRPPEVTGRGIGAPVLARSGGGWRVLVTVEGEFTVTLR